MEVSNEEIDLVDIEQDSSFKTKKRIKSKNNNANYIKANKMKKYP